MNRFLLRLLAMALVFGACSPAPEVVQEDPEPPASEAIEACLDWRWVGISQDATCPAPPNNDDTDNAVAPLWTTRHLFPVDPASPSPLDAFCLYEHAKEGDPDAIRALVDDGRLQRADRDCAAVATSGEAGLSEALAPGFQKHFLAQAGHTKVPAGTQGVRLAFLDTSRTREDGLPGKEISRHGFTMTHLAWRLLCDEDNPETCAARITTRLALPLLELGPNGEETLVGDRGGYFGTFVQLSEALYAETDRWWENDNGEHLILNLSIAWDPQQFGGLEEKVDQMPAPIQSIYRALEDATCRGALVVAAAGNRSGGPHAGTGPRLPAAWEARRAPHVEACAHLPALDTSLFAPPEANDPLVVAVGGVDSAGNPLVNARPGAIPRLAAYGDHAVTSTTKTSWTGTFTGSSVATTVVSSAAAAVWHQRGNLRRDEVIELLYLSGDKLGHDALYPAMQGDESPKVHRVSLCRSLQQACLGHSCAAQMQSCTPWSHEFPKLSQVVDNYLSEHSVPQLNASQLEGTKMLEPPCQAKFLNYDVEQEPVYGCPADEIPGIWDHVWTGPQPYDIPCPSCTIDDEPVDQMGLINPCGEDNPTPYALTIEVAPHYAGGNLTSATLEIGDTSTSISGLPDGGLEPGNQFEVTCIDGSAIEGGASVSLSFVAEHHGAVSNPVAVIQ